MNKNEYSVAQIIESNNCRVCKEVLEKAKMTMKRSSPWCRKMVLGIMKAYDISDPREILRMHRDACIFLSIGECRECLKMIAENEQLNLEVE